MINCYGVGCLDRRMKVLEKSLIFAPLEGITDGDYREVVAELVPEWDFIFTDFFRVPSAEKLPKLVITNHLGKNYFHSPMLREKTVFQLLAAPNSNCHTAASILQELDIPWIDLNAGCPSRKVNAHCGGAWLMSAPDELKKIIRTLRKNFRNKLSVKIRSGYQSTHHFEEIIKIVEGEGADALTVHPRTRDQMYQGKADWNFIKLAVEKISIPVIGNGDLTSVSSMEQMLTQTHCHSLMVGRAAVGNPMLASLYKGNSNHCSPSLYLSSYAEKMLSLGKTQDAILKRLKGITNFMPYSRCAISPLLRTQSYSQFFELLSQLECQELQPSLPD